MFIRPSDVIRELSLEPGMHVAEFGAGTGVYSLLAAHLVGEMGKVYAIDIQKELLQKIAKEAVREHLPQIQIIWGDIETEGGTRLRDDSVDVVIISNVLFQLQDRSVCVKEIARILRPTGRVLVIDWADASSPFGPNKESLLAPEQVESLFTKFGFVCRKKIAPGDHHYGMLCNVK